MRVNMSKKNNLQDITDIFKECNVEYLQEGIGDDAGQDYAAPVDPLPVQGNVLVELASEPARAEAPMLQGDAAGAIPPTSLPNITLEIIEQPAHLIKCEFFSNNKAGGLIHGASGKSHYLTIRITNNTDKPTDATVVISCIFPKDNRAHPYKLAGHKGCNQSSGACTIHYRVQPGAHDYKIKNLGILRVQDKAVKKSLEDRKQFHIDPLNGGFGHLDKSISIMNRITLRLAFELNVNNGRVLEPVVSSVIRDDTSNDALNILHYSNTPSPIEGGTKIFMFCDKVPRNALVEFYDPNEGWTECCKPLYRCDHGLVVQTPPYKPRGFNPNDHRGPINVQFRVWRPTISQHSDSRPLEYFLTPGEMTKRKRLMPTFQNFLNTMPDPLKPGQHAKLGQNMRNCAFTSMQEIESNQRSMLFQILSTNQPSPPDQKQSSTSLAHLPLPSHQNPTINNSSTSSENFATNKSSPSFQNQPSTPFTTNNPSTSTENFAINESSPSGQNQSSTSFAQHLPSNQNPTNNHPLSSFQTLETNQSSASCQNSVNDHDSLLGLSTCGWNAPHISQSNNQITEAMDADDRAPPVMPYIIDIIDIIGLEDELKLDLDNVCTDYSME